MDISAIQAKLLLSQIGGTKELTKANVAQNTKVIQKEQKKVQIVSIQKMRLMIEQIFHKKQ